MLRIISILVISATSAIAVVDFEKQVQPILVDHCLKCHRKDSKKSDYKLDTRADALGDEVIVPGNPDKSLFIELIRLEDNDDDVMPPAKEERITQEEKKILTDWISEGAIWPDKVVLKMPAPVDFKRDIKPILDKLSAAERDKLKLWIKSGAQWPSTGDADELKLVARIHAKVREASKEKEQGQMAHYSSKIPASKATYHMIAVPGGNFRMGSPEAEEKRKTNEGPQRLVQIAPFWIGKFEVSWDQYESFMIDGGRRNKNGSKKFPDPNDSDIDLVSRPTKPYVEMTFGMGKEGFPAISMTQHAALQYCKWLSAQTGHFYRLPTEAEWEYACRAGTTTKYSFGDNAKELHSYAWFIDNADFTYQKIGTKKPNPWGIHDMHGNVAEWTLDIISPGGYNKEATDNPLATGRELYPRAVRGGSWNDFADGLRSATRLGSRKSWKQQDPQLPKSIWYHTDAQWLGFRIVRPLEIPSPEQMQRIWNMGIDHDTLE
ncbi:MAG: SUMF1/EgtB/PvdO family nonheme iron enzyme [Verrucomicrobiaceae bacterium]|nr:SUMF1/EgtB/PvdO family nonheme iron enzyme [Verrucomicrobiaceae bacterium]